jgi:hypothetical protein
MTLQMYNAAAAAANPDGCCAWMIVHDIDIIMMDTNLGPRMHHRGAPLVSRPDLASPIPMNTTAPHTCTLQDFVWESKAQPTFDDVQAP